MSLPTEDERWYRLPLSREQVEFGFIDIIRAELEEIWISRGAPDGFTVWLKEHDEYTELYFSPAVAAASTLLMTRFNTIQCRRPRLETLHFLLGRDGDERPDYS